MLQGGRFPLCGEIKWVLLELWLVCDRRSNGDVRRLKSVFPGDLHFAFRKFLFSLIIAAFVTCSRLFNRCFVVLSLSQDSSSSRTSRQPQKRKGHLLASPLCGRLLHLLPRWYKKGSFYPITRMRNAPIILLICQAERSAWRWGRQM